MADPKSKPRIKNFAQRGFEFADGGMPMVQQAIAKAPPKERKKAAGKLINMMGKIAKMKKPMPDALPAGAAMGAPGQPMPPPQGMGNPVPGMKAGGGVRGTGIARKGFGRGEMR